MKIFRSKKSIEVIEHWPFWIIFSVVISIMSLIIFKISGVSVEEASKMPDGLEDEIILASRFFNSAECFVYVDDMGVPHPGIIDNGARPAQVVNGVASYVPKDTTFTQPNLDKCFPASSVKYSFSLRLLKYLPPDIPGPPGPVGSQLKTFNWVDAGFPAKVLYEDVLVINFNSDAKKNVIEKGLLIIEIKNVE